jgi:hypothetical protein
MYLKSQNDLYFGTEGVGFIYKSMQLMTIINMVWTSMVQF